MIQRIFAIWLLIALFAPQLAAWVPRPAICSMCKLDRKECCCTKVPQMKVGDGLVLRCPTEPHTAVRPMAEVPGLLQVQVPVVAPMQFIASVVLPAQRPHQAPLPLLDRPPRG